MKQNIALFFAYTNGVNNHVDENKMKYFDLENIIN